MNNDLISREALKKLAIPCEIHNGALTDMCVPLYQIDNAPTVTPTFGLFRDMLCSDCEKRPQGEWIPVSERLPEKRGVYIVTEKVFSLDDREHKGRYNTMVEQVEYCNGKWQRARFFEVIAWQPLPEPYKKGGAV